MIRNKFLNNRKATKNSLALTTALCLSMGTLIGNSTFAMELQDDNLQGAHSTLRPKSFSQSNNRNITAEQLRKDLERSSASVPADLKHYLEESNRNNKLNFCQDPETDFIQIENNSIFILSGNIVGMSDLKKNIAQQPNISIFCVYSEYFSFDEDIETPGATLFIDASHWSVKGKRMINLSGEQGRDHRRKKASNGNNPGADGTNGSPGSCGENGGHFYGRGLSFENLENLTINVSGGRGGKGQDGGDGADGADGENGKKSNFENAGEDNFLVNLENLKPGDLAYGNYKSDTYEMVESGYVKYDSKGPYGMVEPGDLAYGSKGERIAKKICTDNEKYRELYQSGERGKAGGNAGAGGEGGKSGQKGSIIINGDGYQAIATEKNGTDGSPGSPGLGGKDGTVWQRTYINECTTTSGINPIKVVGSLISAGVNSDWEDNPRQINYLKVEEDGTVKKERAASGVIPENHVNRLDDKNITKSQNTILEPLELLQQAHIKKYAEIDKNIKTALNKGELSQITADSISLCAFSSREKNLSQIIIGLPSVSVKEERKTKNIISINTLKSPSIINKINNKK